MRCCNICIRSCLGSVGVAPGVPGVAGAAGEALASRSAHPVPTWTHCLPAGGGVVDGSPFGYCLWSTSWSPGCCVFQPGLVAAAAGIVADAVGVGVAILPACALAPNAA